MMKSLSVLAIFTILISLFPADYTAAQENRSTPFYEQFLELDYYGQAEYQTERIQPYTGNPRYWQYKGEPVLLIGATDQDNLFNHPDIWPFGLESHLDLMVRYGGNYVRNTMSSRDVDNEWAFGKREDGLYDLESWNDEYWTRFRNFLDWTYERDIIVQIEIWDRFDFARGPWNLNPFNPKNNINYSAEESRLPEVIDTHPGQLENPFFRSTTAQEDNPLVRQFQKAFVNKMLSISLDYPNVLYCISNETNESPYWSDFWAYQLFTQAKEAGRLIFVTEMWDAWDLSDPEHNATFHKPEMYRYVDISQNNHQRGETHWNNAQTVRRDRLDDGRRPMNSIKIYGGEVHGGGLIEGTRKLWRNIFGGFATSRFHRSGPLYAYGAGLSSGAQAQIKSMRMMSDEISFFEGESANHLLSGREDDEAYAFAVEGEKYAVYFPNGGEVYIELPENNGYSFKWLDIIHSRWLDETIVESGEYLRISAPGSGPWAVLILSGVE